MNERRHVDNMRHLRALMQRTQLLKHIDNRPTNQNEHSQP